MRNQNWPTYLEHYINAKRDWPFEWGSHDCALFAAGAIDTMCGGDCAKEFKGRYKTKAGAKKILTALGYDGLPSVATAKLGPPYPAPTYAKRGDIVAVDTPYGIALAVVGMDGKTAWAAGHSGLCFIPMKHWLQAWEV